MPNDRETLLAAKLRLPQHVVHRTFAAETVVLNLETGTYHGLNRTAGRMLDVLNEAPSVQAAAVHIAKLYGIEQATVETDMTAFCGDLLARQLIEIVGDDAD